MFIEKIILLPVEVKSRELDSKIILSLHLLEKFSDRVEIILGKSREINRFWKSTNLKPFIYFANGLDNDEIFYRDLNKKKGSFVFLDEEGAIISKITENKFPRIQDDHPCLEYTERYYFWGKNSETDLLKRQISFESNKSVICGNLRLELSKPKYFNFFKSYYKNHYKDYVLINTAFGVANAIVDSNVEINHWKNKKNSSNIEGNMSAPMKYQKKLLKHFVIGIKRLVKKFSNEKFIIRPSIRKYNIL